MSARVLVVDNDPEMVKMLERHLTAEGLAVTTAASGQDALAALEADEFAVVLSDLKMDGVDGLAVAAAAHRLQPGARVLLMTAYGSMETAIEAIRHGAYDYLTKPFRLAQVTLAVRRALDDQQLRDENRRLRAEVQQRYSFESLLGRSRAMQQVFDQVRAVANSEAAVLLVGESGSGKELVARAIHWNSPRRDHPFVPVNCAAIPEPLLESELFGHEKGAFTGAAKKRRGLFTDAHGGTLFLDEIADMPVALQAKLLRALQDKVIRPVGGNEEVRLDVRIISATNRDLPARIAEGKFREDLYYRLAVIPIRIPSLRERTQDIPLLAREFLDRSAAVHGKQFEGFSDEAMQWLLHHRWPGNVRELENVVERAATLAQGPLIGVADLKTEFASAAVGEGSLRPTLAELQSQYIRRVLAETRGDKRAAASILGISVRTLQRMFRE